MESDSLCSLAGRYGKFCTVGLSNWAARLHRLAESIPWDRFLGYLKFKKFGLKTQCLGVKYGGKPLAIPLCVIFLVKTVEGLQSKSHS
jgi:hypothetical protein